MWTSFLDQRQEQNRTSKCTRAVEGVKLLYQRLINDQEERNKVRKLSGNECPGEFCFFKEFFGA